MVYIAFENKYTYKFVVQRITVGKDEMQLHSNTRRVLHLIKTQLQNFLFYFVRSFDEFCVFENTKGISVKVGLKEKLQRVASAKIVEITKIFILFFVFLLFKKKGAFRKLALITPSQKKY